MFALNFAESLRAVGRDLDSARRCGIRRSAAACDFQVRAAILSIEPDRSQPLRSCQVNAIRIIREMRVTSTLRRADQHGIAAAGRDVAQINGSAPADAGYFAFGVPVQQRFGLRKEFVIVTEVSEELIVNRAGSEDDLCVVGRVNGVNVKRSASGQLLRLSAIGRNSVDVTAVA